MGYIDPIKIITEVLLLALILILYAILFIILWGFRYVLNMMPDVENVLDEDEFFADIVDTLQEGIE